MASCCSNCGGPLYRRHCLGTLHTKDPRERAPRAERLDPFPANDVAELVWERSFTADNGNALRVARWLCFAEGPWGRRRVIPANNNVARRRAA
jgi:hypothetical protein